MAAGDSTYLESDGKSVNVSLLYTVPAHKVAYADGWLGISAQSGDSGSSIALQVDDREYQFTVPSGLSVSKGQIVYIDVADTTGHVPDDTAYSTTSGANRPLFKATADKDANHVVTGKLIVGRA